ncbi:MAG: transcriptional repressor [Clostridiaceae bacterium]|nr:transcriptional repressor [Clostridiaceae bacterium]
MEKKIVKNFEEKLKNKGYRNTEQRQAVLSAIIDNQGRHLSTEEIYDIVKEVSPEIGLATVYRTLLLLEEMKLIHKIDFNDGRSRYELTKSNEEHLHHHLVCTQCGSINEVKEDLLGQLEDQIYNKNGFLVTNHSVKFYGICSDCQKKQQSDDFS